MDGFGVTGHHGERQYTRFGSASEQNRHFRETEAVLGLPVNERGDQLAPGGISAPQGRDEQWRQRTLEPQVQEPPGGLVLGWQTPVSLASELSRDGTAKTPARIGMSYTN